MHNVPSHVVHQVDADFLHTLNDLSKCSQIVVRRDRMDLDREGLAEALHFLRGDLTTVKPCEAISSITDRFDDKYPPKLV